MQLNHRIVLTHRFGSRKLTKLASSTSVPSMGVHEVLWVPMTSGPKWWEGDLEGSKVVEPTPSGRRHVFMSSQGCCAAWYLVRRKKNVCYFITNRKHGEKEPQLFSQCGSFDHHALQSLNNWIFVFLDLPTGNLGVLWLVIYRWKCLEKYIFNGLSHTPKHLLLQSYYEK